MFGIDTAALLWFFIGFFLILAELAMPGFVVIFFGVGAWVTTLLLELGLIESFNMQLVTFLIASFASLVLFRKKGRKIFEGKTSAIPRPEDSMDDFKGQRAMVVEDIRADGHPGRVEFHGTRWLAESEIPILNGTPVQIVERKNLTLHVKPL